MLAAWNQRYRPVAGVEIRDIPKPEPGKGQVLLRVTACSVNSSDVEQITGFPAYARVYGLRRPRNHVLGSDVAGVIEALGPEVDGLAVGDRVFGDIFGAFGGFAEYVAALAKRLIPIPDGMDDVTASLLPQAGVIALQALRGVEAGQDVLINGAGGGMGSFAIQIAKAAGAHVTAVDNAGKADLMADLGADEVFDYRETDFTALGRQWDLVLDLFGTRRMREIAPALAPDGGYLIVGGHMRAMLSVLGAGTLRSFGGRKFRLLAAKQSTDDLRTLAQRVLAGEIRPPLDRTYPLAETAQALACVAEGRALGKVAVIP